MKPERLLPNKGMKLKYIVVQIVSRNHPGSLVALRLPDSP